MRWFDVFPRPSRCSVFLERVCSSYDSSKDDERKSERKTLSTSRNSQSGHARRSRSRVRDRFERKKSTRDAKRVFPVRFESSREDDHRHFSPARFSDSRVRMRLVLSASLSLRLDFFFRSPIEKLKARHEFPLSLFARSLRARPSSSRPRRSSRQERITAAQKRPILATFFLPSRKYTRTKTRQKYAEFVTPEYEEKGKTKKKRRRGKKLVQKRKENEATKDEKKKTDEGN